MKKHLFNNLRIPVVNELMSYSPGLLVNPTPYWIEVKNMPTIK
jgi:hypothetical protein